MLVILPVTFVEIAYINELLSLQKTPISRANNFGKNNACSTPKRDEDKIMSMEAPTSDIEDNDFSDIENITLVHSKKTDSPSSREVRI